MDSTEKKEAFELNGAEPQKKSHDSLIQLEKSTSPKPQKKIVGFRSLFQYPRGTYFCLGNEFSERFSYYGMRAVLTIYLIQVHGLSSTMAKLVYHTFAFTAYFTPIFGSILSDGFFGRYRVILFVSIIYCIGYALLTISAIPSLAQEAVKALDYIGLLVIEIATGGIKPCVSAFAADQFPESMAAERTQFFSFFYFSINLGALLSQVIMPIFRNKPCLGHDTCFPLAFGVPAIFMCVATLVFWAGTPFYKITKVRDNIIGRVFRCIWYALKQKITSRGERKMHWLDYASPKFDQALIDDVKALINITLLFIPVILFSALLEQQGSTWVLQGSRMNGRVGRLTILPDQMVVMNPLLIILLIPVFEGIIYPLTAKCNVWTRELRRMCSGGFLAAVSFIMAGFLQLAVDKSALVLPADGQARLAVANFLNCDAFITDSKNLNFTIAAGGNGDNDIFPNAWITVSGANCGNWHIGSRQQIPLDLGYGYFAALFDSDPAPSVLKYKLEKTPDGKTRVYALFQSRQHDDRLTTSISLEQDGNVKGTVDYNISNGAGNRVDIAPDLIGSNEFDIFLKNCPIAAFNDSDCTKVHLKSFDTETGAAHVFVIPAQNEAGTSRLVQVIQPNSVSIVWQIPQFIIITIGEILFSISGLAFSYSQASPRMKSVFQAMWLLTSAFGNLIDMGLSGSGLFEGRPATEFFVYGVIMAVIMVAFVVLAWRYKHDKVQQD